VEATKQTADTRGRILQAAEHFFAEEGIGASLREISRAAGQGNTRAAQYHFGDRHGLVLAVMAPYRAADEARRNALLDGYEASGETDVRRLAHAFVQPLAAHLDDPGGRRYLRIVSEYFISTPREDVQARHPPAESITRWHRLLDATTDQAVHKDAFQRFAPRISAIRIVFIGLARRAAAPTARETDPGPGVSDELFVSFLVDQVTALLGTRMSPETLALRKRRGAGARR
jgi:AcrR family transcriptional regulator